jgi:zinc finger protein
LHAQIEKIVSVLESYYNNQDHFTIAIDDPTGNSYIENLCAPNQDPQMTVKFYSRTKEMEEEIGLPVQKDEQEGLEQVPEEEFDLQQQVHVFPGNCSRCNTPSETRMHMLGKFKVHNR